MSDRPPILPFRSGDAAEGDVFYIADSGGRSRPLGRATAYGSQSMCSFNSSWMYSAISSAAPGSNINA